MPNKLRRAIAVLAICMLTFAHVTILAEFAGEVQAATAEWLSQNEKTNHSNVQFNSHLGNGDHETEYIIGEDSQLYAKIKVTEGYLKNAIVEFTNTNFTIIADKLQSEYVQEVQGNKVIFHEIAENSEIEIAIPIQIAKKDTVASDHFAKETKTIFQAIYVNNEGKEKAIEKEVVNHITWKAKDIQVGATQSLSQYLPYTIGETQGMIVQTIVKSGIVDSKIAISKTMIEMQAPQVSKSYPTRVIVTAQSTQATNGSQTGIEFGTDNYTYNAETGTITIQTSNNENEIAWTNAQDTYVITMVYEGEEAYNQVGKEMTLTLNGKVAITPYNAQPIEKDVSGNITLTEQVGNLVHAELVSQAEVSKGYIYANYNKTENKIETPYHIIYQLGSDDLTLVDSVEVAIQNSQFVQQVQNTETQEMQIVQNAGELSTIKTIYVDKDMFQTYLGEEGSIEIYQNGQLVGTIAKPQLEEGQEEPTTYSFDCTTLENTQGITFKTSTLQKEGNLYVEVEKAIQSEIGIAKDIAKQLNQIQENILVQNYKEDTKGNTQTIQNFTALNETTSKAEVQMSTKNLSTVVTNKNIEIKAILEADTLDDALYTNPILQMQMPQQVEKVDIKSTEILFTDELQNVKATYNAASKTIDIQLQGIQTEYNLGSMIKGPTVRIVADITTQTLIPSSEETIIITVANQEDGTTQTLQMPVNMIAPTGLVTINEITGYSENEQVQSVTGDENVGTLDIYAPAKIATIKGTIINNLEADATDVHILGRVPFEGNKKIDSQEELGTNLTTNMASGIQVNGMDATVYYSTNAEATKDLEKDSNQWTTQPQDLSQVKSYLIVSNEEQVEKTNSLDFSYQVIVPENLPHNKDAYTTYKAYYNSESEVGTMAESVEAPIVGLSTQTGPELSGNVTATVAQGATIHGGEYVRFFVEVTNTGSVEAKNVQVKVTNPEGTTFVTYDESDMDYIYDFEEDFGKIGTATIHEKIIEVGNIPVGKSKTVEYELKVQNHIRVEIEVITETEVVDDSGNKQIVQLEEPVEVHHTYPEYDLENTVLITADELENGLQTENYTVKKVQGQLELINRTRVSEVDVKKEGDQIEVIYEVKNITDTTLENVQFEYILPNGITLEEAYMTSDRDGMEVLETPVGTEDNLVTATIASLTSGQSVYVMVTLKVITVEQERFSTQAQAQVQATGTDIYLSNVRYISLARMGLEAKQLEPEDRYVKEGNPFDLTFEITNTGDVGLTNVKIECAVPELVNPINDTIKDGKIVRYLDYIPAGGTSRITIPVVVDLETEEQDGLEVTTKGTVSVNGEPLAQTNNVTHVIEYVKAIHDNTVIPGEDTPGGETGSFIVSGQVWLDRNVNGQKDETEETIGNVKVLLLHKSDNSVVKDQTTGEEKILTTDVTGKYTFSNLQPGEYLVAFLYDFTNYELTVYQKEGIPGSANSDGIDMYIHYNGEKQKGAVTNTITITNNNVRDIDLGLITAQSFDLKLDKYITKVTRVNSAESKTYTYDNQSIAKIDTLRKRLNESNIIVEYKLVVTNEGAIPGYVKKVVDYLPEDLKFTSELNTDWYVGNDGNLYSNKLANEEIQPGESREITLVLTKQMTENNLGNSRNTAELYETYNVLGKADVDSTPANKIQNEDDISSADLVLSIVTGKIASYTGIVITSIALIAFGAYEVKKHVLDKVIKI